MRFIWIITINNPSLSYLCFTMTSLQSDTESNVSGFIHYSDKNFKYLYKSAIKNMEIINQDLLHIEKNLKGISEHAGPLESQLVAVLQALPKPNLPVTMEGN